MKKQIIRFIEKNVDGCGSDAEVMVIVDVNNPLTSDHATRLEAEIASIKSEWDDSLWDTDELVEEALLRVFGSGVKTEIVLPDIYVEF